jgi:hypothetical protein
MGEFITRGMALGFFAGVSTALFARRHAVLKKHPNLLGFAVAGTVDALSRDYRRPMVYDKLMKLDSPLAVKARSILFSIRTGVEEEGPTMVNIPPGALRSQPRPEERVISTDSMGNTVNDHQSTSSDSDWWAGGSVEESGSKGDSSSHLPPLNNPYGYPIKLPTGGPLQGKKTWEEIRRENQPRD